MKLLVVGNRCGSPGFSINFEFKAKITEALTVSPIVF